MKTCTMDGCDRLARSQRSPYCEMHYQRWWRKGSAADFERKMEFTHSGGYIMEYNPGHPLCTEGNPNYVYQHRRVFYDHHGSGPFRCHHCRAEVTWADMHVDHLDDDPANNNIGNLVASCPTCNQGRGMHKVKASHRASGVMLTAFGQTRCITEWAEIVGVSRNGIKTRLMNGWSVERAVSEPRGKFGPKRAA